MHVLCAMCYVHATPWGNIKEKAEILNLNGLTINKKKIQIGVFKKKEKTTCFPFPSIFEN